MNNFRLIYRLITYLIKFFTINSTEMLECIVLLRIGILKLGNSPNEREKEDCNV